MYPGQHARDFPDKPAYLMAETGEVVTYGQLNDRSNRCARLLRSLGLQTGDPIAIFMENHLRFLELPWTAQRAGLYYTAISSRLTSEEVAYIVGDCGAKVLFTSAAKVEVAAQAAQSCPGLTNRYVVDGGVHTPGFESYDAAVAQQEAAPVDRASSTTTIPRRREAPTTTAAGAHWETSVPGRRRIPPSHRPQGVHDHFRRGQHLPAGGRECSRHSPESCRRGGVPSEEFGEEVKAVVQPLHMKDAGPELEAELLAYCRQRLSKIKCPRSIDFDAELPRHPTGKLYKRRLRDRYWADKTTRIA